MITGSLANGKCSSEPSVIVMWTYPLKKKDGLESLLHALQAINKYSIIRS